MKKTLLLVAAISFCLWATPIKAVIFDCYQVTGQIPALCNGPYDNLSPKYNGIYYKCNGRGGGLHGFSKTIGVHFHIRRPRSAQNDPDRIAPLQPGLSLFRL